MEKVLVVGYGAMAKAILSGVAKSALKERFCFEIAGRDKDKIAQFVGEFGGALKISTADSADFLSVEGKIVLLCVKPHALGAFAFSGKARLVYSVLAGARVKSIRAAIEAACVARLMPNIGALVNKSATCAFVDFGESDAERDLAESNLAMRGETIKEVCEFVESFGVCVVVDKEDLVDVSIATSGSSMAFMALFAQGLVDAGVLLGLTNKQSGELVNASFEAFGELIKTHSLESLKEKITSPGGTTAAGLAALESSAFKGAVINAAKTSVKRARSLGRR